jgi:hypothetical protein
MSKRLQLGILLSAVLALLLCSVAAYVVRSRAPAAAAGADRLLLLLPDAVNSSEPEVRLWLDAASEEGLHMGILRDSELLRPTADLRCAGIVVPDEVHRSANDALVGALYRYVERGGHLMLVYDAATWDLQGHFVASESRLSSLAGVHYALYDQYLTDTMHWSEVWGTAESMRELAIPPGSSVPMTLSGTLAPWRAVSKSDNDAEFALTRYRYGSLKYPSFRTAGSYDGTVLLQSKSGLVAGYRNARQGGVLFVNLPLGYLENRTDGLLLHSFLRYFATRILGLPYLSPVPDGIGGLVLNWQLDSRSALSSLARMERLGLFSQGPFSEHITAGPDLARASDHAGFDVEGNPQAQRWVRFFLRRGDAVGSHGGWMHDYFGDHVNETDEQQLAPYLDRNDRAVTRLTGSAVREYSAPLGNQPAWVTRWLEQHGFVAYYFAGDAGMAPTQVYRDGVRDGPNIWAFPILHMGKQASLEEMEVAHIAPDEVEQWLSVVADYTASEHVARLIYSHPMGTVRFAGALSSWFSHTAELARQRRFRWYTMTELADFLNVRKHVEWELVPAADNTLLLRAADPNSLNHFTWIVSAARYAKPAVLKGTAEVRTQDGLWLVTAGDSPVLKISLEEK